MQTLPRNLTNFAPRLGLAWSPDKKHTWVFQLRSGLFFDPTAQSYLVEANRLNRSPSAADDRVLSEFHRSFDAYSGLHSGLHHQPVQVLCA